MSAITAGQTPAGEACAVLSCSGDAGIDPFDYVAKGPIADAIKIHWENA